MMRSVISAATAFTLAGAIGVFGQEPGPQEKPAPPPQEKQEPAAETLTGCVQEAKTTDGGTAYLLNKVAGKSSPMFVLTGPPPTELASHVSHKVEVTGKVQEPNPPAEGTTPDPKVLRPPLVIVESVKMVADKCD